MGCISFELMSTWFRDEIDDTTCTWLLELADSGATGAYDHTGESTLGDELVSAATACNDERIRARDAINFYVFDFCDYSAGTANCSSKTSYGGPNLDGDCYTPGVFIDVGRIQHQIQSPEEHEMGHALGLRHNCDPGIKGPSQSSNIMQSGNCDPVGSGGARDLGFGEIYHEQNNIGEAFDQQAMLLETSALIQANWCGEASESLGEGLGEDLDGFDDGDVADKGDKGCTCSGSSSKSPGAVFLGILALCCGRRRLSS